MIHLKRYDEGVWYNFTGASGVRVKIKPVSLKEKMDIRVAVRRKMVVQINGKDEIVDDYDEALAVWMIFQKALEDWEGITFEGGEKLTKEDKKKIIFEYDPLREFILEKSNHLLLAEDKKLEEELKNSEGSGSGSPSETESR